MRKRLALPAAIAGMLAAAPGRDARAQDLGALGVSLDPPPGWTVALQPDGSGATIAFDPADLVRAVSGGARIRMYVDTDGSSSAAEESNVRVVEEPGQTWLGGRPALTIGLEDSRVRRRVISTASAEGRAYRFDLEAPSMSWPLYAPSMEAALATVRFRPGALATTGGGAPPDPGVPTVPPLGGAGGAPTTAPDQPQAQAVGESGSTFTSGQPIPVNFSNLPGTWDWITIVPAGAPDDRTGEWYWSDGSSTPDRPAGAPRRSGRIVFSGLPPGEYEVRLYHDWPNGGYLVRARRTFTVAGIARDVTPPRAATSFTGRWETVVDGTPFTMILSQDGDLVTGTFDGVRGAIQGTVNGMVLVFTWIHGSNRSGTGQFTWTGGGSFSGTWRDAATGRGGYWNGTQAAADAMPAAPPLPTVADVPADPALQTEGSTFEAGQPIPVHFSQLPGTYDWMTIVPAGTPEDRFGEWFWSDGSTTAGRPAGAPRRSGRIVFSGLPPGAYEVRLYLDWPNGGYRVRGRRPLTVLAAAASPPPSSYRYLGVYYILFGEPTLEGMSHVDFEACRAACDGRPDCRTMTYREAGGSCKLYAMTARAAAEQRKIRPTTDRTGLYEKGEGSGPEFAPPIRWGADAHWYRGRNGERMAFACPPNGRFRTIYGTGVYTDASSICTAAVHAGVITLERGGRVTIEIRPGASTYAGSTRNGVTSRNWSSTPGSFVVLGGH